MSAAVAAAEPLDLKLWLRLFACTAQIERRVSQRLRARFGSTLPRFDYLAQLGRHGEDGLRMKALSQELMVSGGNVTALTDQLARDGLVERMSDPLDRRAWRVRLTPAGRAAFAEMAAEHARWLGELLAGLPPANKQALSEQLGRLRTHLAEHPQGD